MAALRILKKVKTKMAVATRYGFVAWEYQFKVSQVFARKTRLILQKNEAKNLLLEKSAIA